MKIKSMYWALLTIVLLLSSVGANALVFALPAHVLQSIKPKPIQPVEKLTVMSMNNGKEIKSFPDKILIKNTGNIVADNIRVMLSSEISKSFKLSDSAIKFIAPKHNVTITFELNGNPNKDMSGGLLGYKGEVIILAEHHKPIILPVNIGAQESNHMSNYMDKIASMTKQRSKISLINNILDHGSADKGDVEVTTRTGSREINAPSDEIVIKNTSDRTLNNIRIIPSKAGNVFLLDKYSIPQIAPNGEVSIQMISKMDAGKYTPRDYRGEIIIAPENGIPKSIPVLIKAAPRQDSINEFEVRIANGEMNTSVDRIHIKNVGNRTMDSVRVILSDNDNLARIFSINNDTFRTIAPNEEVTVEVKYKANNDLKTFMQNHNGEMKIVSEHHNMRTIAMNIQWNKIESDNFVIYARNGDVALAKDVLKYLETHYQNVTSTLGTVNHKSTIYVTGSMEEMQLINYYGNAFYSYNTDTIFVCSCDSPEDNALQEFIYRAMINNFLTYYNAKKVEIDDGNWFIDGLAKYFNIKTNETAVGKYIEAFKEEPVDFQWYGSATDAHYGAAITFFRYLEERYGEDAIYRSLYYLGSGMISNHRCDTIENCAILSGVYDASGLDINNKRYYLDFDAIVKEWASYLGSSYGDNFIDKILWETTNFSDVSIYGNHAFVNGQEGFGVALSLDGSIDRYVIKNSFNGFPNNEITAAFWMRSSDTTKAGTPISYAKSAAELKDFLIFDYRNFNISIVGSETGSTGVSANDGKWHHITVTWESSDGTMRLFKDAVEVFSGKLAKGETIMDGGSLVIGQEQDVRGGGFEADEAFFGEIDDVRIYTKVLSDSEILSLFNGSASPSESMVFHFLT